MFQTLQKHLGSHLSLLQFSGWAHALHVEHPRFSSKYGREKFLSETLGVLLLLSAYNAELEESRARVCIRKLLMYEEN